MKVGESFQSKTRVERGKMVSGVKWVTQLFIMVKSIETKLFVHLSVYSDREEALLPE